MFPDSDAQSNVNCAEYMGASILLSCPLLQYVICILFLRSRRIVLKSVNRSFTMKLLTTSLVLLVVNVCLAFSAAVKTIRDGHKRFELDVTWEVKAPDGYSRPQILINGQSPGPTIHVTQGDCVEASKEARFATQLRH